MLHIYYGRESTDREEFIFQQIKGKTLLIVPDQFSLQAERDAFFYLKETCLMDLRVMDFSTLGRKAVDQAGGRTPKLIDKYGRHMLLTKVLRKVEDQLTVYKNLNWKNSFIDMVNSFLSEMKRYDVTAEALSETVKQLPEGSYLKLKLEDITTIYAAYQEMIEGKYLDSEDYISFYGEKLLQAPMVTEAEVWIYGFDTFTPKNLLVIERLLKAARQVNIVMTYEEGREIFGLTKYVMATLRERAEALNEEVHFHTIEGHRKRFWADNGPADLAVTSNLYAEAERAAAYILKLVREEGYRFGDMVVVCNDMELRGGILRRTFLRWGIPVFMDKKRKVMHHPSVSFLLAMMEIIAGGYQSEAVMRLIKSGLMGIEEEDAELLENYTTEFRVKGAAWKTDFTRGGTQYDDETLQKLNELRRSISETIEACRQRIGGRNTAGAKIEGLYAFLREYFQIHRRLEELIERQKAADLVEGAAETAQSWNVICNILDQMIETLGEERISNEELTKLMVAGLEEMEIGLVPVSSDCVIVGTMQRTRLSRIKVLLVVGANDGVLPLQRNSEGLLSEREKVTLESMELVLSKRDEVTRQEEQLAIYRTLHLPEERLYVSCCHMDEKGEALRPSEVFLALKKDMERKDGRVLGDLDDSEDFMELLPCKNGTLSYMAEAFRKYYGGGAIDEEWMQVINWYEEYQPEALQQVKRGMAFDHQIEALGVQFADALYRGDKAKLEVSASRLEKYGGCPFAHFIMYGLKVEEPAVYEMGAREVGDVYHQCLMKLSQSLTPSQESGIAVNDPNSAWMTITREQVGAKVEEILRGDLGFFREGLLNSGREEAYRTERIASICSQAAWSMIMQVRKGNVKTMHFEQPFGQGRLLPPVQVDVGEVTVEIRGKIDRIDVLQREAESSDGRGGANAAADGDAVRIVDYKTGSDSIDLEQIRDGYALQLMVYLKAAMQRVASEGLQKEAAPEPAGVFYFKIKELDTDADAKPVAKEEVLAERLENAYRLEGVLLNDHQLMAAMDREMDSASSVIPVKWSKKTDGYAASAGGYLLSSEEFHELMEQVDHQVERICREICEGEVAVRPRIEKKKDRTGNYKSACTYCGYKSICLFEK